MTTSTTDTNDEHNEDKYVKYNNDEDGNNNEDKNNDKDNNNDKYNNDNNVKDNDEDKEKDKCSQWIHRHIDHVYVYLSAIDAFSQTSLDEGFQKNLAASEHDERIG